jgi:hypothetical protein
MVSPSLTPAPSQREKGDRNEGEWGESYFRSNAPPGHAKVRHPNSYKGSAMA